MKKLIAAAVAALALVLSGCTSSADVASQNIATAAEAFEVQRTLVGIKAEEQTRILGGLLRLPITRTQAWDRGWDSVSITDAISVVRDEQ